MTRGLGSELERLPGVLAATVFGDPDRGPRVYLATTEDTDREAIRSAAQAVLRDRGVPTDLERIHVGAPPPRSMSTPQLPGVSLDSLDVHRTEGRVRCEVRLRSSTRTTTGEHREPDTARGRARAAAIAVLRAAEALDPDLRLGLHGARGLDLFGFEALAVLVEATAGRAHVQLPGVVLVERSVEESAALATLDALRSWLA